MRLIPLAENTFISTHAIASVELSGVFTIPLRSFFKLDEERKQEMEKSFRITVCLLDGRTFELHGDAARNAYETLIHATMDPRFVDYRGVYNRALSDYQKGKCPFCGKAFDPKWERCLLCDSINLVANSTATFHRCFTPDQSLPELLLKLQPHEAHRVYVMLRCADKYQNDRNA